jgi:hypothetical protein
VFKICLSYTGWVKVARRKPSNEHIPGIIALHNTFSHSITKIQHNEREQCDKYFWQFYEFKCICDISLVSNVWIMTKIATIQARTLFLFSFNYFNNFNNSIQLITNISLTYHHTYYRHRYKRARKHMEGVWPKVAFKMCYGETLRAFFLLKN